MTEYQWLACAEPQLMLDLLRGKISYRKLRLFIIACIRARVGDQGGEATSDEAAAVLERDIEGRSNEDDDVSEWWLPPWTDPMPEAIQVARSCQRWGGGTHATNADVRKTQAAILRCVTGPVLFRPIILAPACLTGNHATVPAIARHIYDDRAFHDLPILADALEDAGCSDPDILAHCRSGGEHVRGCWVVDLILGKA